MKSLLIFGPGLLSVVLIAGAPKQDNATPVNLNVMAVDGVGQPVTGLKAEDFQIADNGKPRKVVWLQPLRPRKEPAVFILLDLLNANFQARGLSTQEVTRAVEKLETGDNVYLYLLTPGEKLFVVHGVGAPQTGSPADEIPWNQRIRTLMDTALQQVNALKPEDDRYAYLRMKPTWKALAGVVSQIAEASGPKSFVWVTQGVENGYWDSGRQFIRDVSPIRQFGEYMTELETAAYSVQQRPNGSVAVDAEGSPTDTLTEVSALTGGRVFPTDTTEAAIEQALKDARRVNYRIAFQPEQLDGKYHKIRVTSTRKDVKIQAADHYYAIAGAAADAEQRAEAMEDAIAASPFEFDAIGVSATAAPTEGAFSFSIRINTADVEMIEQGGRYKGGVHVAFVESRADGKSVVLDGALSGFDMSQEEYAKALEQGIALTRQVKLDAGTKRVRVVALDRSSWLAGTATVALK